MSDTPTDCLFCKIVAGEVPSAKVYEDEHVLAFLDLFPLATGHALVIPKAHHVTLGDLPSKTMERVGAVLPRVARAVAAATGVPAYNLLQSNGTAAGQEILHAHFHIVPRAPQDGIGFCWKAGSYGEGEMEAWRERIARAFAAEDEA